MKYIWVSVSLHSKCVIPSAAVWTHTHTHSTQISSWTHWIQTEPWRSWLQASAGASGSPWSLTDPGAETVAEGAGPSSPRPGRRHHTTPPTGPTGWRRHPLQTRRTHWSRRGSTPPTWWERCAAWSSPRAAQSTGTWGRGALRCDSCLSHTTSGCWNTIS